MPASFVEQVRKEIEELHNLDVAPATQVLRNFNPAEVMEYGRSGMSVTECASLLLELV